MTPTNELRFVEREVWRDETDVFPAHSYTGKILQQKWIDDSVVLTSMPPQVKTAWIDVPTEEE